MKNQDYDDHLENDYDFVDFDVTEEFHDEADNFICEDLCFDKDVKILNEQLNTDRKKRNLKPFSFNAVPIDSIYTKDGKAYTTSLYIANKLKRKHVSILRAIDLKLENLDEKSKEFCVVHLKLKDYIDKSNRVQRVFEITKEGFSFIGLSLTGKKSIGSKIEIIENFMEIEKNIKDNS